MEILLPFLVQVLRCARCLPDFSLDTLSLHRVEIGIEGDFSTWCSSGSPIYFLFPLLCSLQYHISRLFWCMLVVPASPNYFPMFFNKKYLQLCRPPKIWCPIPFQRCTTLWKGHRQRKGHEPVSSHDGDSWHHLTHTGGDLVVCDPR